MILVFVKYRVLTDGIRKYNTFINLNSFTCREYEIKVIVLYCIVLYCIVLYCIVLYCIVLYRGGVPRIPRGLFWTGSRYPSTVSGSEHVFSISNVYNVGLTADFLVTLI